MRWGTKWGRTPSGPRSFWGVLLNEIVQQCHLTDGNQVVTDAACETSYVIVPAFGSRTNTTFTWPYVSPTKTVALRNPKFGDVKQVDTQAIVRRTKAGYLDTYKAANWPTFYSQKFTIENCSPTDVTNMRDFYNSQVGAVVGLLDHTNRQWQGFITSPELNVVKTGVDDCTYEVSFEFLGTLV